jgi:hypothetical protein
MKTKGYSVIEGCIRQSTNNPINKQNKRMIMNVDIVYATDDNEFFFTDTDEAVPSGELVGFDVETENEVEFVLQDNIYWNPDASVEGS